jgi:hypothetical protein
VLRETFGRQRDEVTCDWSELHSAWLRYFYSSLNIAQVIKSRRMKWARHVARMEERRYTYRVGRET